MTDSTMFGFPVPTETTTNVATDYLAGSRATQFAMALWETLFRSALRDHADTSTTALYERSLESAKQGANVYPNGTICLHTLQQLHTICESPDVCASTDESVWDTTLAFMGDISIARAFVHIFAGVLLCYLGYKLMMHFLPFVLMDDSWIARICRMYVVTPIRRKWWHTWTPTPHHRSSSAFDDETNAEHGNDNDNDNDDDDDDGIDTRSLFVITLNSAHPSVSDQTLQTVMGRISSVDPPRHVARGTQGDTTKKEESSVHYCFSDTEHGASTNSTYQRLAATFRNCAVSRHVNKIQTGSAVLQNLDDTGVGTEGRELQWGQRDMSRIVMAFIGSFMTAYNCILKHVDIMWNKQMARYEDYVKTYERNTAAETADSSVSLGPHYTSDGETPLETRAIQNFVLSNPVLEKRWYAHFLGQLYPQNFFEDLLKTFSGFEQLSRPASKYTTLGHVAILISPGQGQGQGQRHDQESHHAGKIEHQQYHDFMIAEWNRRQRDNSNQETQFLVYTPSNKALQDLDQMAREITTHADAVVDATLQH